MTKFYTRQFEPCKFPNNFFLQVKEKINKLVNLNEISKFHHAMKDANKKIDQDETGDTSRETSTLQKLSRQFTRHFKLHGGGDGTGGF